MGAIAVAKTKLPLHDAKNANPLRYLKPRSPKGEHISRPKDQSLVIEPKTTVFVKPEMLPKMPQRQMLSVHAPKTNAGGNV